MKYQYELACREAGVDEEKLRAIRRVFDTDRKRLKRENETMNNKNIQVFHISAADGFLNSRVSLSRTLTLKSIN